jgi:hypothetical protein
VQAFVRDGALELTLVYSRQLHESATIDELAAALRGAYARLAAHGGELAAGGLTAADFPRADLDPGELAKVLDLVEDME